MKRFKLKDGKIIEDEKGQYVSADQAEIALNNERGLKAELRKALEATQRRYEEALGAIAQLHSLAFDNVAVKLRLQREIDDLTAQVRRLENERGR